MNARAVEPGVPEPGRLDLPAGEPKQRTDRPVDIFGGSCRADGMEWWNEWLTEKPIP